MAVRWKHKKTGNVYRIVSFVIIEKTLAPAVCYEPVTEPNAMFIRPCAEFFDGRFEMVVLGEILDEPKSLGGTSAAMQGILP